MLARLLRGPCMARTFPAAAEIQAINFGLATAMAGAQAAQHAVTARGWPAAACCRCFRAVVLPLRRRGAVDLLMLPATIAKHADTRRGKQGPPWTAAR